jgi:hypothetical protein
LRKSRLAAGEQHQGNSSFQAEVHCGFRTIERSGSSLPDSRRTLGPGGGGVALGRCLRCDLDGPWHPSDPRRPLATQSTLADPCARWTPGLPFRLFAPKPIAIAGAQDLDRPKRPRDPLETHRRDE